MLVQITGYTPVGNHVKNSTVSGVVSITAAGLIPTNGITPDGILFQAQVKDVYCTLDGQAPTSSDGFLIRAGDPAVYIPLPGGVTLKVIESAASATISYQAVKFL